MGTGGPVGFEPGMFKKEADEAKPKGETTNKVITNITHVVLHFFLRKIDEKCSKTIYLS